MIDSGHTELTNFKEGWDSFDATFDIVINLAKERSYARWWRSSR